MTKKMLVVLVVATFLPVLSFAADAESASPTGAETLMPLLPEASLPDGWTLDGSPQWYHQENLFEHNNGAAEQFIDYGFRQALVARYAPAQDATAAITICLYDMGNRENAFGLYSAFRSPQSNFVTTGSQGFLGSQSLTFWIRQYMVTVQATHPSLQESLRPLGNEISARIGYDTERLPDILNFMAAEPSGAVYKAHSLKLIAKRVFGLDFLNWGYTASYKVDDREVSFFIFETDSPGDAKALYNKCMTYFKKNQGAPKKVKIGDASFVGENKDTGKTWVMRSKRFVVGLRHFEDQEKVRGILEATLAKIGSATAPSDAKGN